MIELTRSVRFCLTDSADASALADSRRHPIHNSFSAFPAMRGLGRYYQLRVTCQGAVDPATGYFLNIKQIDRAVRQRAIPVLAGAVKTADRARCAEPGTLMGRLLTTIQDGLGATISELRLDLSPFSSLGIRSGDMDHAILSQQFEFSAAHRLHVPTMSPQANRRFFGKCNSPSGHGHNYRLEVSVRVPVGTSGAAHLSGRRMSLEHLDALVDRKVIQKLDHKNLNSDVAAFTRLNPTVENIAAVIYGMLATPLRQAGVDLDAVTVWETSKTQCTYRPIAGVTEAPVRSEKPGRTSRSRVARPRRDP